MIMTKLEKQSVMTNTAVIPKVYELPKLHKLGKEMRPIVCKICAPTHNLA